MSETRGELYGELHLTEEQRKHRAEALKEQERAKAAQRARDNVRNGPSTAHQPKSVYVDKRSEYMARPGKREHNEPAFSMGKRDARGIREARGRSEARQDRGTALGDMLSARDVAKLKGLKSR